MRVTLAFGICLVSLALSGCGNETPPVTIETSTVSVLDQELAAFQEDLRTLPKAAQAGGKLFFQAGCLTCHTYAGHGSRNLGAPDLTSEGAKKRGLRYQIRHLACPSCVKSGSPMPSFGS